MKNISKILFVFVLIILLFNTSCKKDTLTLETDNVILRIGESITIEPITNVEDPTYEYLINDNSIISIENNTITALKVGTTSIEIKIKDSKAPSALLNVTVEEALKPSKINTEKSLELIIGTTHQLEYNIEPFNASQEVTFTSADKDVLTVDENGLITCHNLGETFINIKSVANPNVKVKVNIEVVLPQVEQIECVDEFNIGYYETKQLVCSVSPTNAIQDVTYKSLDEEIVTIDSSGLITSHKPGTTKLIITSVYDESVSKEVVVTVSGTLATSLTTNDSINVELGSLTYVEYNIYPTDAYGNVEYIVSDNSAIEVNDKVLTAKKNGTYNLTLKTIDGSNLEKTIKVVITGSSYPVVSLSEDFEKDTNVSLYEPFNPLHGLRIFDAEDGELTKNIIVNSNVNTNEFGKYYVTYEVSDSDGNSVYYERNIEVVWDYSVVFIGHAGSLFGAMNSEEAIIYAATVLKYTAIEIDIKQTKDGVFVLSHDDTFGGYALADYDYSFLKNVEITSKRGGGGVTGLETKTYTTKLCTLSRYLEICRMYNITAVIELKYSKGINNNTETSNPSQSRMPALVKQIEDAGMINNVIFLGSQYECLAWTRRNGYSFIPCQYLVISCESDEYLNRCIQYNFDISINVKSGINTIEWIQKYKDAGLKVSTYTFDQYTSYKEIQSWIDKGVDFVTTDSHDPKELNL